jgi:hypothetical protein
MNKLTNKRKVKDKTRELVEINSIIKLKKFFIKRTFQNLIKGIFQIIVINQHEGEK